ncbi:hypothetical protein FRX31_012536, partial [Thalictrum thalictroides]
TESGNAGSAQEAECQGILAAIRGGIRQQLKLVMIETDNKGIADFLNNQDCNLSWTASNFLEAAKSSTESGNAGSAQEAECQGILAAIRGGIRQQLKLVMIETDNKGIADFLNNQDCNLSWTASNFLEAAKSSTSFNSVFFSFCNRSGNHLAHILAQKADRSQVIPTSYSPIYLLLNGCLNSKNN